MTCGIYLGTPKNTILDKVYIGQSTNIEDRVQRHNTKFLKKTHSPKMQEAFNTYGEFSWEILAEVKESELNTLEAYYIELFNAVTIGFNTYEDYRGAPILRGTNNGNVKRNRTETYLLIIQNTLNFPAETKQQIAIRSNATVEEVKSLWVDKSYHWLEELDKEGYLKVLSMKGTRQTGGRTALQQGIIYPVLLSPELAEYSVYSIRGFAREHNLDHGDLTNVLNLKVASVKGWIVKDLDINNPEVHTKFYSSNRGHYKKQFDKYVGLK
jgi:group I intron endonuclease